VALFVTAVSLAAGCVALAAEQRVVHSAKSDFGTVYVVDEGDLRFLRFDQVTGNDQSMIRKSDPTAVPMEYIRVAAAGLAFTAGRERALVMGLGGGAFPMMLHRRFAGMKVDVVEINPVVADLAKRFFSVREDERLKIIVDDGARYMKQEGPRYDVILLDAYSDEGIPEHLRSAPFFEDVKARLAPKGAAVINIALMSSATEKRIIRAYASVFEGCVLLRGQRLGNTILVGTQGPALEEAQLRDRLKGLGPKLGLSDLNKTVADVEDCVP
jgi:spermidine synthase